MFSTFSLLLKGWFFLIESAIIWIPCLLSQFKVIKTLSLLIMSINNARYFSTGASSGEYVEIKATCTPNSSKKLFIFFAFVKMHCQV